MDARGRFPARALLVLALLVVAGALLWSWWQSSAPLALPVDEVGGESVSQPAAAVGTPQPRDVVERTGSAREVEEQVATAERWVLRGKVFGTNERAVANAQVRVVVDVGGVEDPESRIEVGEASSDVDGTFEVSLDSLQSLSASARVQCLVEVYVDAEGYVPDEQGDQLDNILAGREDGPFLFHLESMPLVKGRVVLPDGSPVVAEVAILCDEGNDLIDCGLDGSFAFPSPEPEQVVDLTLIARHQQHGRSRPISLRLVPGREVRAGDVVLESTGHRIVGVVRWPDQRGVAGVDVEVRRLSRLDDVVVVDGVRVSDYDELFDDESLVCTTDLAGRFVANYRRPGRYRVSVGDLAEVVTIPADRKTTEVELGLAGEQGVGQVVVRIEDQHGRWLPDAIYTVITWEGEQAEPAERRHAAEGVSAELLASAPRRWLHTASDRYLSPKLGSFSLIEAVCHDAGPVYATCRLRPERYREDVRIVLAPRTSGGEVRIVLRDSGGQPLQPVWVRMSRTPGRRGVPIALPGRERFSGPESEIDGHWYAVPEDGRITNLPTGPMHFELLPAMSEDKQNGHSCVYAVLARAVQVTAGAAATIDEQVLPGARLEVEMRMAPMPRDERLEIAPIRALVRSLAAGWTRHIDLSSGDELRSSHYRTATWQVGASFALPPGRYEVRLDGVFSVDRYVVDEAGGGDGSWTQSRHLVYAFEDRVELRAGGQPLVVSLKPR